MSIDPNTIPPTAVYKILIGCIVPRPIAFVSTVSPDGVYNLAPFSFFNVDAANFRIDPDKLRAIGRMGGAEYTRTQDRFILARPKV